MKKHAIFLGFLIFVFGFISPLDDIKELETRLPNTIGRERLNILLKLTTTNTNSDPLKTIEYGTEALRLLVLYPDKKLEVVILNHISTASNWIGNYTEAEKYALQSRENSQIIKDYYGEAEANYNIALVNFNKGLYDEAKKWNIKTYDFYNQQQYKEGLARSLLLIASISQQNENLSIAMSNALKALEIYEKINSTMGIAAAYNICGIISNSMGEHRKGLNYYYRALKIYEKNKKKPGMIRTIYNIGDAYFKMSHTTKAMEYFQKSLKMSLKTGTKGFTSIIYSQIGETFIQLKDFKKALDYFNQSITIKREINDLRGITSNLIKIGICQSQIGELKEALLSLTQGLESARKFKLKKQISKACKELSLLYEKLNEPHKAFNFFDDYSNIDEEIFNEKNQNQIIEIQTLYETGKKEKELNLLKKDKQLQQLKIAQQKNIRYSFTVIGILILFLVSIIYKGYRLKTKTTKALRREINDHKITTSKLTESEEKFRTLVEKSAVGISIIQDDLLKYANPTFLEIFGYQLEELYEENLLKLVIEEDRSLVLEKLLNKSKQKIDPKPENDVEFTKLQFRGLTKTERVLHLECYCVETIYEGKSAILKTVIDITERKKAEAEFMKMRKLESVGILAGNLAQDFKDLLTIITENSINLKKELSHDANLSSMVENIAKTSDKAIDLTQKLINFSPGGESSNGRVFVQAIINSTTHTYPRLKKILQEVNLSDDLKSIYGDENALTQVLSNILWNAQEAHPLGKDVSVIINAENVTIFPGNHLSIKAGEYVSIKISDDGKGIPPHQLEKVFDPYFSTKDTFYQKGMGLGLTLCYSIIKKLNGYISIKSEEAKGTTVELLLPAYHHEDFVYN